MKRYSSAVDFAKSRMMSRPDAVTRALSHHGYAPPSSQTTRVRHVFLRAGATASTWEPPVGPVCVGPSAKRRRRDTMRPQFEESDVACGDSFHTANSAAYYNPPDARSPPVAAASDGRTTNGSRQ